MGICLSSDIDISRDMLEVSCGRRIGPGETLRMWTRISDHVRGREAWSRKEEDEDSCVCT